MSFCEHCVVAVPHDGTPAGKIEQISGIATYVAIPDKDYPKDKAVVIFTDVFGLELVNNKLLADGFAQNGFQTYTPNLFGDEPLTDEMLSRPGFNLQTDWFPRHSFASIAPKTDAVLTALRERGIKSVAFVGYCFGARPIIDYALARYAGLKAIAINHPSFIDATQDWEKLLKLGEGGVPLLINSCETDPRYGKEAQEIGDKLLGDGKYKPGYKRTYWPGCTHGFAVRGDLSKPEIKAGKEGAFKATVDWFIQYL